MGQIYCPEVDGLRAVAVTSVICFHAKIDYFSQGYLGVDIFFVISGFLIHSILIQDLNKGDLSLTKFYERRAKRILPALFFVIIAVVPFAYLLMLPDDLENFGQSLVATSLSANNVLLTWTTGYWDVSGDFKPLTHSWSLAVEEQFYVFFPIFVLATSRHGGCHSLAIMSGVFGLSFFLA